MHELAAVEGDDERVPLAGAAAFVKKALEVALANEGILPRQFNLEEMKRDVELFEGLYPLLGLIDQLQELVADAVTAVGHDAYLGGLVVYTAVKQFGGGAGLDSALAELRPRFARKGGSSSGVSPAEPAASSG